MTTQWTDLIDTDPVGAYQLMPKKTPDEMFEGMRYIRQKDRLMSNLAALCEALSSELKTFGSAPRYRTTTSKIRIAVMMTIRNPDGSRRFPEIE